MQQNLRRPYNSRPTIRFSPAKAQYSTSDRLSLCRSYRSWSGASRYLFCSSPKQFVEREREIVSGPRDRAQITPTMRGTPRHRSSREMRSVPVIDRFGDTVPLGDTYTHVCICISRTNPSRGLGHGPVKIIFPQTRSRVRLARAAAPAIAPKEIGDLEICTAGITFPSR